MKITNFSLLFLSIFIMLFFGFGYYADQVANANKDNVKEEQSLLASTNKRMREKGIVCE